MLRKITKEEKMILYIGSNFITKRIYELKETQEKVAWLLATTEHLRNCDKCLIQYFWRVCDGYKGSLSNKAIHSLTPAETITRQRRFIQNTLNLYPPTDEDVAVKRNISKHVFNSWFSEKNKGDSNVHVL